MTIAEIHGKISETGTNLSERMEDLLTSNVFGCMRYLPAEKALVPFLSTARSYRGNVFSMLDKITTVHYSFWPWLKSSSRIPCEPDVVVGLEREDHYVHLVLVEAKYHSGLSSDEDERPEPSNQLARELDNLDTISCVALGWSPWLNIASRTLLFVTQDMGMPHEPLAQSLSEYNHKRNKDGDIFWTSWRFLPSTLEKMLESEIAPTHRAVLEDMHKLLLRKELVMFRGVERITNEFNLSSFEFYQESLRNYDWSDVNRAFKISYEYSRGG